MLFAVPVMFFLQFAFAVVLTLPVSALVLWRYRVAVLRNMTSSSRITTRERGPSLQSSEPSGADPTAPDQAAARRRLAVIYTIAGLAAGTVQTILFFLLSDVETNIPRAFVLAWGYSWATVPVLAVLLVLRWTRIALLALVYVLTGALVLTVLTVALHDFSAQPLSPLSNLPSYFAFLAITSVPPLIALGILGTGRVRPVSSLVLSVLLVLAFAYIASQGLFLAAVDRRQFVPVWTMLGASMTEHLVFMVLALPAFALGWLALRRVASGYRAKSFSDVQLLVDTWWFVATFASAIDTAEEAGWRCLWCLLGFVVYRAIVEIGLRNWPIGRVGERPSNLLLLRVFGYRRRTERVFDAVARRWRFRGPVLMIGAPDVAARTIEPGNFLAYVGGDLGNRFIRDEAELAGQLVTLDRTLDPDARYRVNELLCSDGSWRSALVALLERTDLVLMDLRGFDRSRQGCRYELGRLGDQGLLGRTVVLTDPTTDAGLLGSVLEEVSFERPGLASDRPTQLQLPAGRIGGARMELVLTALDGLASRRKSRALQPGR